MAKTKRLHIKQSYFKSLRKWFSRQARRFSCISKIEDIPDGDEPYESASRQPQGRPTFNVKQPLVSNFNKNPPRPDECRFGEIGEHLVAPVVSTHGDKGRNDSSPKPPSSAPTQAWIYEEVSVLPACKETTQGHYHQGNIPPKSEPQPRCKTNLNLKRHITSSSNGYVPQPVGCGCGGMGEHPVGSAASAHSDLERNDRSPQSSSSSPTLIGTTEEMFGFPDCRKTVLGNYHQGNIPSEWDPSAYQGTQCTSTAFTAIVASAFLPVGLWSSSTINRIVRLGDRLHDQIIETMKPGTYYLAADEMPKRPEDMKYTWPVQCTKSQEYQGLLYPDPTDRVSLKNQLTWELYPGQPLREFDNALERCFEEDVQGCIITLNYRSSAIFKSSVGEYVVFDSHAKNILGNSDSDGKASLLRFPSLSQLVTYFRDMTARETRFSLTGFKVESTC